MVKNVIAYWRRFVFYLNQKALKPPHKGLARSPTMWVVHTQGQRSRRHLICLPPGQKSSRNLHCSLLQLKADCSAQAKQAPATQGGLRRMRTLPAPEIKRILEDELPTAPAVSADSPVHEDPESLEYAWHEDQFCTKNESWCHSCELNDAEGFGTTSKFKYNMLWQAGKLGGWKSRRCMCIKQKGVGLLLVSLGNRIDISFNLLIHVDSIRFFWIETASNGYWMWTCWTGQHIIDTRVSIAVDSAKIVTFLIWLLWLESSVSFASGLVC